MPSLDVKKKLEGMAGLPSIPRAAKHISELATTPHTPMKRLERAIGSDPAMAARMLRFANSEIYGFPNRIDSLSHSLILLGVDMIRGLILSTRVMESNLAEAEALWRHSLAVSWVASELGVRVGLKDLERVSLVGLLHDLGKLALLVLFPGKYETVARKVRINKLDSLAAEIEVFGVGHAEVAGQLCQSWSLPSSIYAPIVHHHSPDQAKEGFALAAVIHVADVIVKAAGVGHTHDTYVPPVVNDAWRELGISEDDLKEVVFDAAGQLRNLELLDPFSG